MKLPGTLRPARAEDVPRLIEIARRSWLSAFAESLPFPLVQAWVQRDREPAWYQRDWPAMLVLEAQGVVIGLVQPQEAEINGLWVHPGWQGRGAGTLLLHAGEEVVRRTGHPRAWLICSTFNLRALAFYRGRGYVETGRVRYAHASGLVEESLRMERSLLDDAEPADA